MIIIGSIIVVGAYYYSVSQNKNVHIISKVIIIVSSFLEYNHFKLVGLHAYFTANWLWFNCIGSTRI